ncbi:MAG TPA: Zn-dependent hydrolase [Solirubrobacterales bacterium]|jgi:N-carbamoyl-L-amino-acid hydrolase
MSGTPAIDCARVIADLRELDRRTGTDGGAQRLCWGEGWRTAREFLGELLAEISAAGTTDSAGNLWASIQGAREPALVVGSHLDSVPDGGWLDGALGVMAGLGVLRAWSARDERPPRTLTLVDWADEEGARFGRSLFGSSAFAGTLEPADVEELRDADGRSIAEVLGENDVELGRVPEAATGQGRVAAYLELHIEQGPVLEAEGLRAAAVSGCAGVERHRFRFMGQASHAGTTPMDRRRDAGLAAAETALQVEAIGQRHGGLATTGALALRPGIPTAVAGEAELTVDLRHPDAAQLAAMLGEALAAGGELATRRNCALEVESVWRIEPIPFDTGLVNRAREACSDAAGSGRVLASGALHDAAEVARIRPAAMVFCPSTGGISHAKEEDTPEPDLAAGIEAFGLLANRVLADSAVT